MACVGDIAAELCLLSTAHDKIHAAVSPSLTKLEVVIPFAVAIVLYLIGPLLTARVRTVLQGHLERDRKMYEEPGWRPPHLSPEVIQDYAWYVVDAAQIIPSTLLPVLGAVLSISANIAVIVSIMILILTITAAFVANTVVLALNPFRYMARQWRGISLVSGLGIVTNLFCVALILVFG